MPMYPVQYPMQQGGTPPFGIPPPSGYVPPPMYGNMSIGHFPNAYAPLVPPLASIQTSLPAQPVTNPTTDGSNATGSSSNSNGIIQLSNKEKPQEQNKNSQKPKENPTSSKREQTEAEKIAESNRIIDQKWHDNQGGFGETATATTATTSAAITDDAWGSGNNDTSGDAWVSTATTTDSTNDTWGSGNNDASGDTWGTSGEVVKDSTDNSGGWDEANNDSTTNSGWVVSDDTSTKDANNAGSTWDKDGAKDKAAETITTVDPWESSTTPTQEKPTLAPISPVGEADWGGPAGTGKDTILSVGSWATGVGPTTNDAPKNGFGNKDAASSTTGWNTDDKKSAEDGDSGAWAVGGSGYINW